jgi:hypothetical protein
MSRHPSAPALLLFALLLARLGTLASAHAEATEPRDLPSPPLVLPADFAPQPVHVLGDDPLQTALKPWPAATPVVVFAPLPVLPPFSLHVLAALPSETFDAPPPPKLGRAITIAGDNGGWLEDYFLRFRAQVEKGAMFRIDGRCASACTLVLAYPDRVCATKRAVLGFHEARNRNGTRNQRVTANMMDQYPLSIRDYIAAHGGLPAPTNMMWVSGAELRGLVKQCDDGAPAPTRREANVRLPAAAQGRGSAPHATLPINRSPPRSLAISP